LEDFLYPGEPDQSLCGHKPLQAVGKILARLWKDHGGLSR